MKLGSQYSIPDMSEEFIELANGYQYFFHYSLVETHLLKIPHKHNCREYREDATLEARKSTEEDLTLWAERPRSKDECFFGCTRRLYNKSCRPSELMIKREPNDRRVKLCEDMKPEYLLGLHRAYNYCEAHCPPECTEFSVEYSFMKVLLNSHYKDRYFMVSIVPKKGQKKRYIYVQAMPLQKLFADAGGIGGLWLGFNILAVYHYILQFIPKCLFK